jgi:hypothetical protein
VGVGKDFQQQGCCDWGWLSEVFYTHESKHHCFAGFADSATGGGGNVFYFVFGSLLCFWVGAGG